MPSQDTWAYIIYYGGPTLMLLILIGAAIKGPGKQHDPGKGKPKK